MEMNTLDIETSVLERFIRYVKVWTTSNSAMAEKNRPSTEGQWDLLNMLKQELLQLGVPQVNLDDKGYLVGRIPSNSEKKLPTLGFMAHVDTAEDAPGEDVNPLIHRNWDGSPLSLENGVVLDPEITESLARFTGDTIISSDGTTLLGADDKAGVAEIMTAVEILMKTPSINHGDIEIIFTPDEETGCGMDDFPLEQLESRYCFTLDGGVEGELETECYNAWRCDAFFQGKVIHPGYARGKLVNAVSMASHFVSLLPRSESPEATDGFYGNYWAHNIWGSVDKAEVSVMVRDFSEEQGQRRLNALRAFADAVEAAFPGGEVSLKIKEQYKNMKGELDKHPDLESLLVKSYEQADVLPEIRPIRGGTDGARLTAMGIPTPNIFAGGMNFHSVRECVPLSSMVKAVKVVLGIMQNGKALNI